MELHPLHIINYRKRLSGDTLKPEDLMAFSKVSLRRKRMRKKFAKRYSRYVSRNTFDAYIAILAINLMTRSFIGNDLVSTSPMEGLPTGKLYYLDYQYKSDNEH
jgi:hypothetical protein